MGYKIGRCRTCKAEIREGELKPCGKDCASEFDVVGYCESSEITRKMWREIVDLLDERFGPPKVER